MADVTLTQQFYADTLDQLGDEIREREEHELERTQANKEEDRDEEDTPHRQHHRRPKHKLSWHSDSARVTTDDKDGQGQSLAVFFSTAAVRHSPQQQNDASPHSKVAGWMSTTPWTALPAPRSRAGSVTGPIGSVAGPGGFGRGTSGPLGSELSVTARKHSRLQRASASGLSRPRGRGLRFKAKLLRGLEAVERSLPIAHPKDPAKVAWDVFIMVLIIFNAVQVPIDISYGMPRRVTSTMDYLNWGMDFLFALDICLNFRTAYFDHQGRLIRDSRMIAKQYFKFWFWIDIVATIPYDLFAMAFGVRESGGTATIVLQFLKTPRLLRLGRLLRLMDHIKNANWFKIAFLLMAMCMISHWLACIWYMMYRYSTFTYGPQDWAFDTYNDGQVISYYINAYYQCFLLLMGNNQVPRNNAERVFFILTNILGTCFYAAILGQMALLVTSLNTVALRHKQREDMTLDVLRYTGAPEEHRQRVQTYFQYITQYSHPTTEGMTIMSDLPKALYQEVADDLFKHSIQKLPYFQRLEAPFITAISVKMKIVMFTPKEVIFQAGDLGTDMYIIRKGCVAVVGNHNQLMTIMRAGECFGEIAMLTNARRTAKCVALSHCDLCVLNIVDLRIVMKDFPKSAARLQDNVKNRIRELQVAGRAGLMDDEDMEEDAWSEPGSQLEGAGSQDEGGSQRSGDEGTGDGEEEEEGLEDDDPARLSRVSSGSGDGLGGGSSSGVGEGGDVDGDGHGDGNGDGKRISKEYTPGGNRPRASEERVGASTTSSGGVVAAAGDGGGLSSAGVGAKARGGHEPADAACPANGAPGAASQGPSSTTSSSDASRRNESGGRAAQEETDARAVTGGVGAAVDGAGAVVGAAGTPASFAGLGDAAGSGMPTTAAAAAVAAAASEWTSAATAGAPAPVGAGSGGAVAASARGAASAVGAGPNARHSMDSGGEPQGLDALLNSLAGGGHGAADPGPASPGGVGLTRLPADSMDEMLGALKTSMGSRLALGKGGTPTGASAAGAPSQAQGLAQVQGLRGAAQLHSPAGSSGARPGGQPLGEGVEESEEVWSGSWAEAVVSPSEATQRRQAEDNGGEVEEEEEGAVAGQLHTQQDAAAASRPGSGMQQRRGQQFGHRPNGGRRPRSAAQAALVALHGRGLAGRSARRHLLGSPGEGQAQRADREGWEQGGQWLRLRPGRRPLTAPSHGRERGNTRLGQGGNGGGGELAALTWQDPPARGRGRVRRGRPEPIAEGVEAPSGALATAGSGPLLLAAQRVPPPPPALRPAPPLPPLSDVAAARGTQAANASGGGGSSLYRRHSAERLGLMRATTKELTSVLDDVESALDSNAAGAATAGGGIGQGQPMTWTRVAATSSNRLGRSTTGGRRGSSVITAANADAVMHGMLGHTPAAAAAAGASGAKPQGSVALSLSPGASGPLPTQLALASAASIDARGSAGQRRSSNEVGGRASRRSSIGALPDAAAGASLAAPLSPLGQLGQASASSRSIARRQPAQMRSSGDGMMGGGGGYSTRQSSMSNTGRMSRRHSLAANPTIGGGGGVVLASARSSGGSNGTAIAKAAATTLMQQQDQTIRSQAAQIEQLQQQLAAAQDAAVTERRSMHHKVISLALAVEVLANKTASLEGQLASTSHQMAQLEAHKAGDDGLGILVGAAAQSLQEVAEQKLLAASLQGKATGGGGAGRTQSVSILARRGGGGGGSGGDGGGSLVPGRSVTRTPSRHDEERERAASAAPSNSIRRGGASGGGGAGLGLWEGGGGGGDGAAGAGGSGMFAAPPPLEVNLSSMSVGDDAAAAAGAGGSPAQMSATPKRGALRHAAGSGSAATHGSGGGAAAAAAAGSFRINRGGGSGATPIGSPLGGVAHLRSGGGVGSINSRLGGGGGGADRDRPMPPSALKRSSEPPPFQGRGLASAGGLGGAGGLSGGGGSGGGWGPDGGSPTAGRSGGGGSSRPPSKRPSEVETSVDAPRGG